MSSFFRRVLLTASVAAGLPALASAQQTGVITGRVVGRDGRQPLAEASVLIVGTQRGVRTGADGTYRIAGVPVGAVQVRAQRIGYSSATQSVTVGAGQTASADFELAPTAVQLDVVVTTATGETQRKRESGAATSTISLDTVPPPASMNFSQLVTGKASGTVISQSSGTTGTGARVRIRGANSMSLSNEPLLIIDGVRIDNSAESNSIWVGGQTPSRINDINAEDIDNIEIVKGPAAAALYGTAAANGVIQITTKRGRAGKARWTAFAEGGSVVEHNDYPPNYGSWTPADPANGFPGVPGAPNDSPYCNLDMQGQDYCTQLDSVSAYNPLEDYSPFRTGRRGKLGLSVQGGSATTTYYFSANREREAGIYANNNLDRVNLRTNVSTQLRDNLDLSLSAGYLSSRLQLTQNDDNYAGIISNGLAGDAFPGLYNGYYPFGPDEILQIQNWQELERATGGLTGNFRPLEWLSFTGTLGADVGNRFDHETYPPNVIDFQNYGVGSRRANRLQVVSYTGNVSGTATFTLLPTLLSKTSTGIQYQQDRTQGVFGYGESLTGGIGSLVGVSTAIEVREETEPNKTFGAFISQEFGFRDRLFVTGALRGDKNSAFGENLDFVVYPAVSVSYVISEEAFFPQTNWISSLRLRSAYGQSGLRPGPRDARPYFVPAAAARSGGAVSPGVRIGGSGNANLRPERSGEAEVGFDLGMLGDRLNFELTYYDKTSTDALVRRPLPPSIGGASTRFENLGSVTNRGLETLLNAHILRSDALTWDASITASWNKNELTELGEGIPPIIFGYGSTQRHIEGRSLGGYWGRVITSIEDKNSDGIIDATEATLSDTATYLGNSLPTRQLSFNTEVGFLKHFKLSGLVDYRGGYKQLNYSEFFRCLISTCAGINLKSSSEFEQARASLAYEVGSRTAGAFLEDADFIKLREIAFTATAPVDLAERVGVSGLSLTLSGRNLGMWTKYTGLDPEVNVEGQANFLQADFLSQPQVRHFTARLNVTF